MLYSMITGKILTFLAFFVTLGLGFAGYAHSATFSIVPSNQAVERGCTRSVTIEIDTNGAQTNAAEILVGYDPSQVTILDDDPSQPGVQIESGSAFQSYFFNQVDTASGRIKVAGLSILSPLQGRATFATINYDSATSGTAMQFEIIESEGGVDTTIIADAFTNDDILTNTVDGNITFIDGPCVADTQAPNVNFLSPSNNEQNYPLDGNVTIRITDNQSGVDLGSLEFVIDGITYLVADAEVTYTGGPTNYTFVIDPIEDFPDGEAVSIVVRGADIAGNNFNRRITFNRPPEPTPEPEVIVEIVENIITETVTETETVEIIRDVCNELDNREPNVDELVCEAAEVISGEEEAGDFIEVLERFSDQNNFFQSTFEDTPLGDFFDNVGTSGALATTSGLLASFGIIQLVGLSGILGLPFGWLAILLGKRNESPWGVITDATSGKPISFASCTLFTSGSENRIDQVISDLDGRYGFSITKGDYRLEVKKNGYKAFIREIKIENSLNLGIDINLIPEGAALDSSPSYLQLAWAFLKKTYYNFSKFAFIAGAIFSIIAISFNFSILNFLIFLVYLATILIWVKSNIDRSFRSASVINSESKLRVPYSHVKIFDLENWKLVDTHVTNYNGQFDFYGEPGRYAILVIAKGYKFPSSINSLERINGKEVQMLVANLKRGKNNINIYIDPIHGFANSHWEKKFGL